MGWARCVALGAPLALSGALWGGCASMFATCTDVEVRKGETEALIHSCRDVNDFALTYDPVQEVYEVKVGSALTNAEARQQAAETQALVLQLLKSAATGMP